MKISSVGNFQQRPLIQNKIKKNETKQQKQDVSFKSIYLESLVDLGHVKAGIFPAKFAKKDALLIHELALEYPYQDCFIRKGAVNFPRLEFREKPIEVQVFNDSLDGRYHFSFDPYEEAYETVPMIIYSEEDRGTYKIPETN